jgi:uncharacterized protein YfdQ (DUF2303 family)
VTAELVGAAADMQAVIDAARLSEGVKVGDTHRAFPLPEGARVELVDVEGAIAKYLPAPRRKVGTYTVRAPESFAAYLAKHGVEETEVWADPVGLRIVGVVNAHGAPGVTGWGDHRVVLPIEHTVAWKAWAQHDGKLLGQSDFAELIEERAVDIVRPAAADMLELAQTFQATIGVEFGSSKLLSSGERRLEYRETVDAKAGRAGALEIPRDFDLALVPFEGAQPFKVNARFRYRITDGTLRVGYRLTRPEDVIREAFESVVETVHGLDGTPDVIFRGVPA